MVLDAALFLCRSAAASVASSWRVGAVFYWEYSAEEEQGIDHPAIRLRQHKKLLSSFVNFPGDTLT